MLTIYVEDCGEEGVIEVKGVLLSLVGSGAESITATVTNTGSVRLVSNETQVIRSVVDPLSDDEVSVSPITVIRHDGSIDENKTDDYFHLVIDGGPSGLLYRSKARVGVLWYPGGSRSRFRQLADRQG